MSILNEAIRLLRCNLKDGATIGYLVDLLVEFHRHRKEPFSELELIRCFESAFDLEIGAGTSELIHYFRGGLIGVDVGGATAAVFPQILETREQWDFDRDQESGCWLDTLPVLGPAKSDLFQHPHVPEWGSLSHDSQQYIIRLAMSGALYSRSLRLVACLAERLQEKLLAAVNGEESK